MMLGEENPIIMHSAITGLLLLDIKLNPFYVVEKFKEFLSIDNNFFQFINRVIPIERVCESNLPQIISNIEELLEEKKEFLGISPFCIVIRKRMTLISRSSIINVIAPKINLPVDLKNPKWMIWVEIVADVTGISILKPEDVFNANKLKKRLNSIQNFDD
ncbi:MAG: THUMP domain-containing protein [Promethearchaeota archaeon]